MISGVLAPEWRAARPPRRQRDRRAARPYAVAAGARQARVNPFPFETTKGRAGLSTSPLALTNPRTEPSIPPPVAGPTNPEGNAPLSAWMLRIIYRGGAGP